MLKVVNQRVIADIDDEEDDDGLLEPALAVDDIADDAFDLNVPPTTGNEYLRRVREEAKKCPKVVVANELDTSVYRHKQTVKVQPKDTMPAPKGFSPSGTWVKMQVAHFVTLRQKILRFKALMAKKDVGIPNVKLPQHNDAESWCRLCFGRLQLKTTGEDGSSETSSLQNDGNGTPPLLSIIARMDQPTVIKVLEYHVNWLEATGFTRRQGQWFYSLLASLQKPLTPESCSWLRHLARISSILRATLKSPEEEVLHELNLLICLVANYFDQRDLADKT
ncbi:gem-associated protein 2-like [Littorina saxatilis]|uniref:Gem-associated protein 2 n=1 Tax=Littorina saxatilis TaxID=31220 RepID=A0AAN9B9J2_9CAEN